MDIKFMKNKKTGLLIDTQSDYGKYLQEKTRVKDAMNTKYDLKDTKTEIGNLKSEMKEIKELLKKLLIRKNDE